MKKLGYYLLSILPLLAMLLIQIVGSVIISIRFALIYGEDYINTYMDKMPDILLQIQLITLLITGLWYYLAVVRRRKLSFQEGVSRLSWKSAGIILCMGIAAQLLIGFLLAVWQNISPETIAEYTQLMEESGITDLTVVTAIVTVIMAPISEEIIFRGLTMEYLRRAGARFWVANTVQALFFGIAHMNLVQGTYAFLLGLCCGYLWKRYKTILAPMFLHLIFNAYSTFGSPFLDNLEIADSLYMIGSLVLGAVLMVLGVRWLLADTKGKKLLVTGATGFLGSRIVRHYRKAYQILAPGHGELDICDVDSLRQYWQKERPELQYIARPFPIRAIVRRIRRNHGRLMWLERKIWLVSVRNSGQS